MPDYVQVGAAVVNSGWTAADLVVSVLLRMDLIPVVVWGDFLSP